MIHKRGYVVFLLSIMMTISVSSLCGGQHCVDLKNAKKKNATMESLQQRICAAFSRQKKHPNSGRIRQFIDTNITGLRPNLLRLVYLPICTLHVKQPLAETVYLPWTAFYRWAQAERESGVVNAITLHQTNFTFGMLAMGTLDNCLKVLLPAQQTKILRATLGGNIVANLYYEFDVGQKEFITDLPGDQLPQFIRRTRKDINVDPADLATGVLATVTYFTLVRLIEKTFSFSMKQFCRR